MKVILFEDVKKVGKKDEIVELSDGYARNCILHKGLGVEATPKAINDLKLRKKAEAKHAQEVLDAARALAEKLNAGRISVGIKIGENGRVFGAVAAKEVAEAIKSQLGYDIDKKKLIMNPFKNMGSFDIGVKLHPEVTATLKCDVVEEK
ncbi:MAG: 50S ribosomal protein L9 [Clostridiales bacterium]|nr:50S ribosomal protein L9 [Clostridiales bacterium]